jgi:hypothetical protein
MSSRTGNFSNPPWIRDAALTWDAQVHPELGILQQFFNTRPMHLRFARRRYTACNAPLQGNIRSTSDVTRLTCRILAQSLQILGLGIKIIAYGLLFYARGENATYETPPFENFGSLTMFCTVISYLL